MNLSLGVEADAVSVRSVPALVEGVEAVGWVTLGGVSAVPLRHGVRRRAGPLDLFYRVFPPTL